MNDIILLKLTWMCYKMNTGTFTTHFNKNVLWMILLFKFTVLYNNIYPSLVRSMGFIPWMIIPFNNCHSMNAMLLLMPNNGKNGKLEYC